MAGKQKLKPKGGPTEIDRHVGSRLCQRRLQLNLSTICVAAHAGVSWQQLRKYETGINRVSAGMLWDLSKILNVSISYFFRGL